MNGRRLDDVSEVLCFDLRQLREQLGESFTGILGIDALRHMIVQIDFDRGRLSILRSVPDNAGRRIPLVRCIGLYAVRLEPAGADAGIFLVDSGQIGTSSGTFRSERFEYLQSAGMLSVVDERPAISILGLEGTRYGRVASFRLADFRHEGLTFSEGSLNAISLRYLARYVVTFDFGNMQMYLSPGQGFGEPDGSDVSGLGIVRVKGDTLIDSVEQRSAARTAGIQKGDAILEVDGVRVEGFTMSEMRKAFSTPAVHWIAIRRGNVTMRVRLDLRTEETSQEGKRDDASAQLFRPPQGYQGRGSDKSPLGP